MELRNIQASFGEFQLHVDAAFSGGITGLFGVSGAGKTTLLEIIAGLRKPDRGQVLFNDEVLFDAQKKIFVPARKRRIGYVPQDLALFPHLSVRENICYGERPQEDVPSRFSFDGICRILDLEKNLGQYPRSLSGGEKQRVALARALMARPSLLLLDEPLTGLNYELKEKILSFILHIKEEFSLPMVYVTHSPHEVMALCEEVLLLHNGRITEQGSPRDYFIPSGTPAYRLHPEAAR